MKNKNLFFSLALLSALGGIGGTVVFATGARPMSFIPQAAMSDSIPQGMPSDTTVTDIPGVGNDSIPQGGGEEPIVPMDYTSVMSDPSFEADEQQYWIYYTNGVGTLQMGGWMLDYDVNDGNYVNFSTRNVLSNPVDGYYVDVWAGLLNSLDMYQTVRGLPAGLYRVSAQLRTTLLSDQHVYAQVDGVAYDSPGLSGAAVGEETENWEKLTTTEFIVSGEAAEVRIGVRSTGDGGSAVGWFQADAFQIERVLTAEELPGVIEQQYAEKSLWLDSVAAVTAEPYTVIYTQVSEKMADLYQLVAGREDVTLHECDSVMWGMEYLMEQARAGGRLVDRINSCETALQENPDEEFSAAIDTAKAVAQEEGASEGTYTSALETLETAYAQYLLAYQNPADWNFSGYGTVGAFSYSLDEIHKVACVTSYNGGGTEVEVPERITAEDGLEYTVVGFGQGWGSPLAYGDSIRSVKLPATLRFISNAAFQDCGALETCEIPEAVDSIGESAFMGCLALNSVTLPPNLKALAGSVFGGCSSLREIELPALLASIGNYAFQGTGLKELHLPASVTTIGTNAFAVDGGLERLTVDAVMPPVVSGSLGSLGVYAIYVPEGCGAAYRAAGVWKNYVIVAGDGVRLAIDVDTPGTLGEKVLAQTTDLVDVNYLTLTGSLNEDDIYNIQNRLTSLLEIDMAGTDMTEMPDDMFNGRAALEKVVLPDSLQVMGVSALRGCSSLDSIVLPASLRIIGYSAFQDCSRLKEVVVPEGVTEMGSDVFNNCSNLERLSLPSTLSVVEVRLASGCRNLRTLGLPNGISEIRESAFQNASSLTEVNLPSTLTSLGSGAFGYCTGLTRIELPEKLSYCVTPFSGCENLTEMTCLSLIPPMLGNDVSPLYYVSSMDDRTLYVPSLAVTDYKLTVGWDEFPNIQGINYLPQDIQIYKPYELDWNQPDSLAMGYKPDLALTVNNNFSTDGYGSLKVAGTSTLSLGQFAMTYDPNIYYQYFTSPDYPSYNALVAEAPIRADSVRITLYNKSDRWTFLSFPYDVKVSDIVSVFDNTSWVIRKYSGADRAAGNMEETWQDMTADSVLQAGVGYIWQSTRSENNYCGFVIPAMDNANKNQIFANDTRSVALEEHLAEFSHNRSWNLVGNPFPCFYDIRFMGFTAPITVWNERNNTYEAYSPVDDGFILRPGEAFFVQRPVDMAAIEFPTEGRQVDRTVREMPAAAGVNANGVAPAMRQVFNLTLTDGTLSDRTRFVLNENAKAGYDMATDAGKFMSPDASVPQLYTTEDGVDFSINERPMGNGLIALAARFGSEGMYTLSLDTDAGAAVYLVDKQTGTETDLRQGGYTFRAEAGTVPDRFLVKVVDDGESDGSTTGVDGVEAQGVAVSVAQGRIQVVAPEASAISVYSVDGKAVGTSVAAEASFEVRPGVYVVTVNGASRKVTVIE